ncbi:MAG TPA: Ig-like domain-containing protein [Gemmatimonadaceae bacterium]|nr:Ig-like domain-containing protein [Gemmatimonadaceae bacterium]
MVRLHLSSLVAALACAGGGDADSTAPQPAVPTTVNVTIAPASFYMGSTAVASAVVLDQAGRVLTGMTITWSSATPDIASVSNAGVVTGLAVGQAQIVASAAGKQGRAGATVTEVPVASVAVNTAKSTVPAGKTLQLGTTVTSILGVVLANTTVTWTSSNTLVATVTAGGMVAGLVPGTVTITATAGGKSGSAALTVTPAPPLSPLTDECSQPQAGRIWCDDFESDRTGSYFEYDSGGGRFARAAGVGVDSSTGMRVRWAAGDVGAGSFHLAFGKTPQAYMKPVDDGTANYREIYWRMYVRNQAGWTGGGGEKLARGIVFADSSWAEAAIAHVWSMNLNLLGLDPASGTDTLGNVRTKEYNDFPNLRWFGEQRGATPIFDAAHVGKWYCVEVHMKLNDAGQSNGLNELWINGSLEAQSTNLNWLGSFNAFGINAIFFENYWNAGSPVAQERYIDNLVVSTQRIGCGTPAAGAAPPTR